MHVHSIMHDLPHYITTPMYQYMIIFKCMFMIFKQSKTLIKIKEKKQQQNKTKQNRETETQGQAKQVKQKVKHVYKTKEKQTRVNWGFWARVCVRIHWACIHNPFV